MTAPRSRRHPRSFTTQVDGALCTAWAAAACCVAHLQHAVVCWCPTAESWWSAACCGVQEDEARKYTENSRMVNIQAQLTERALELLVRPQGLVCSSAQGIVMAALVHWC